MDCIEGMKKLDDNSIDSIVTDPPYGLGFMGKQWDTYDKTQFGRQGEEGKNDLKEKKNFKVLPRYRSDDSFYEFSYAWSKEALRILKPGGFLLSFGGTRTYHRMACAIEDAGFEIRDQMQYLYGTGFPKSLNIGKAIDKIQGNKREVIGKENIDIGIQSGSMHSNRSSNIVERNKTKGTSEFEGWGTALKPANEPICVARKPLAEKTVAKNVLKYGTGGINIDGCRIGFKNEDDYKESVNKNQHKDFNSNNGIRVPTKGIYHGDFRPPENYNPTQGRFPANIILDEEAGKMLDEQSGVNASRFFYCAKASKKERNQGLEGFEEKENLQGLDNRGRTIIREDGSKTLVERFSKGVSKNFHPTVKPVKLMEYLVRLVTPKGGIVLDPFMGSGTTGMAAKSQGFNYIGFDMTEEYCKIAEARIKSVEMQKRLFYD